MVNTIDTEIHLNGEQPVQTLKSIKSEVSSLTSAWKAEEIQLKSTGDNMQAAKAKYEGLSQAVNKQKEYIEKLKAEQSQIDQSTNRGAESYAKYGTQIENANRKLASMEAQQTRAKDSWKYYESGVAESKKKLDDIAKSSEAYVKRLEAEGKQTEANKAKINALKSSHEELQNLYTKQTKELSRIEHESGKVSDAYKQQEIRVNELGAKIANTKSKISELNEATGKVKTSPFSRLKDEISGANKEAERSKSSFKDFLGATVVGNAISSGISTVTGKIKEAFGAGMELNKAIGKIRATWVNMGKSSEETDGLITQMEQLRVKTGYSADEIGVLQRSADALTHGNTERTRKISEALASIGIASKLSGENVDALGKSFLKLGSRDVINPTAMAKIESIAPTISKSLAEAAGVSEATFAKMVKDGQITGEKLQDLMVKASDQSEGVFSKFVKSAGGAQVQIRRSWESLAQKLTEPIFSVRASGLSYIAELVSSPVLQSGAEALGQGLKVAADFGIKLLDYINKHKDTLGGIFSDILSITKIIAGKVWQIFSEHVKAIAENFGLLTNDSGKAKEPLEAIKEILDKLAKNKEGLEKTAEALAKIIALRGISKFLKNAAAMTKALQELQSISQGTVVGKVATKVGNTVVGKGSSVKTVISGEASTLGKVGAVTSGIGVAVGTGVDLYEAIKAKNPAEKFKKYGNTLGSAIGGGIGVFFGGAGGALLGSTIGNALGGLGGTAAKGITDGWKKAGKGQKPDDILQLIGFDAKHLTDKIGKSTGDLWQKFQKTSSKELKTIGATLGNTWSGISKGFNKNIKDPLSEAFKDIGNGTKTTIDKAFTGIGKNAKEATDKAFKGFDKSVKEPIAKAFKGIENFASPIVKQLSKDLSPLTGAISKTFKDIGKSTSSAVGGIKKDFGLAFKGINKDFAKAGEDIKKNWDNLGKNLEKIGKNISKVFAEIGKALDKVGKSINKVLSEIGKKFDKVFSQVKKAVQSALDVIQDFVKKGLNFLEKAFERVSKVIGKVWDVLWKTIGKVVKTELNTAIALVGAGLALMYKSFQKGVKIIASVWTASWNSIKAVVKTAWDFITDAIKTALKIVRDVIKIGLDIISLNWKGAWSDVKKLFSDVFNGIVKIGSDVINNLGKVIKSGIEGIKGVWSTVWGAVKDTFGTIMSGLKTVAADALNGVIGVLNAAIRAINSVFSFFSGKNALKELGYISKKAQGGTVGKERLTMVNDGTGNDWKELIQTPKGELFMSHERNTVLPLEEGTRVYNGSETRQIMASLGIERYANGGIVGGLSKAVGGAIDWTKGAISNVGSWIGDKWNAIENFLKDPISNVTSLIGQAVNGLFKGLGNFAELAKGVIKQLTKPVADWLKSQVEPLKKKHDEEEQSKATAGISHGAEYWRPYVLKALQMNGLSESLVGVVLSQISTESGGNPRAINLWDSNAKAGHPSKGLMQTIDSTFNAYAFAGHHDIWNGFDNILAALNYAKHRYGNNLSFLGKGHGYANGGIADKPSIFGEAGAEMAIPLDSLKSSRGYELLGKTAAIFASRDNLKAPEPEETSGLGDKLDKVISLLQQLVLNDPAQLIDSIAGKFEVTTDVKIDKTKLARTMAPDLQKILATKISQQRRGLNV